MDRRQGFIYIQIGWGSDLERKKKSESKRDWERLREGDRDGVDTIERGEKNQSNLGFAGKKIGRKMLLRWRKSVGLLRRKNIGGWWAIVASVGMYNDVRTAV